MTIRPLQHIPQPPSGFGSLGEIAIYLRRMWDALQGIRRGRLECVIEVTLTANAASTVISDPRLSLQSVLIFDPKTANAAAELYGGTMYASSRGNGEWTITHANNAQTDRQFQAAIIG